MEQMLILDFFRLASRPQVVEDLGALVLSSIQLSIACESRKHLFLGRKIVDGEC